MLKQKYILMSLAGSVIVHFCEKYIFADWQFAVFLAVLIALDTLTGYVKHWQTKTISSKGFSTLFIKLIIYIVLLILTHVITHFKIAGESEIIFDWIDNVMYSIIILREAISVLENVSAIMPNLLPKWLISRLKDFQEKEPTI